MVCLLGFLFCDDGGEVAVVGEVCGEDGVFEAVGFDGGGVVFDDFEVGGGGEGFCEDGALVAGLFVNLDAVGGGGVEGEFVREAVFDEELVAFAGEYFAGVVEVV